jgi:hypothetical protein
VASCPPSIELRYNGGDYTSLCHWSSGLGLPKLFRHPDAGTTDFYIAFWEALTLKILRLLIALAIGLIVLAVAVHSIAAKIDRGEGGTNATLYIINNIDRKEQRSSIASTGVDIIEVGRDYIIIAARPDQIDQIRKLGFTSQPLPLAANPSIVVDPAYHTYDQMVADIQSYAVTHTSIMRLITIGLSYEGRAIWAAEITDNPGVDEGEPEVLLTFHQHAREHLTVEQGLYTLHLLTDNYTHDVTITQLVNTRVVWLLFDLNPDGGEYDISGANYQGWRKNRQPTDNPSYIGTDLNRNWDYKWGLDDSGSSGAAWDETYRGPAAFSAPETTVVSDFVASRVISNLQRIKVAIDFHTYSELILWPYGYTYDDVPSDMNPYDHEVFVAMGTAMAQMNGYMPQQASDLYLTNGTIDDWLYGVQRIYAFTFETYPQSAFGLSGFYPPGSVIAAQTERNRAPILYAIDVAGDPDRVVPRLHTYLPIVMR